MPIYTSVLKQSAFKHLLCGYFSKRRSELRGLFGSVKIRKPRIDSATNKRQVDSVWSFKNTKSQSKNAITNATYEYNQALAFSYHLKLHVWTTFTTSNQFFQLIRNNAARKCFLFTFLGVKSVLQFFAEAPIKSRRAGRRDWSRYGHMLENLFSRVYFCFFLTTGSINEANELLKGSKWFPKLIT